MAAMCQSPSTPDQTWLRRVRAVQSTLYAFVLMTRTGTPLDPEVAISLPNASPFGSLRLRRSS